MNGGGEGRGGEGRGRDKNSSGKVWAEMTIKRNQEKICKELRSSPLIM